MEKLPKRYTEFLNNYPDVGAAYTALGEAVSNAGPLDAKTRELVKIGVSVGARMESAVRSHTRRALEAGATPEEVRHAALQATTTVGFPNMMAGLSWVDEVLASRTGEG